MRVGSLLLLLGALTILVIQNSTPALPLVLFGGSTIALPVGVWLLVGVGAGLVTSLLLQGLTFQPPTAEVAPRYRQREPRPKSPPESRRQPQKQPKKKDDWTPAPRSDWDASPTEEPGWDIEAPPTNPTEPQVRPARSTSTRPAGSSDRPKDGVYDADYRVIEPPKAKSDSEPEENWEF